MPESGDGVSTSKKLTYPVLTQIRGASEMLAVPNTQLGEGSADRRYRELRYTRRRKIPISSIFFFVPDTILCSRVGVYLSNFAVIGVYSLRVQLEYVT